MDTFGQRLVASRERHKLSQKDLAEQLGITPTRLNYWEKDKREPAIDMIKAIAQILEVDTNYLIGYQCQTKSAPLYPSEALSEQEQQIMNLVKQMSLEQKDFLIALLHTTIARNQNMPVAGQKSVDETNKEYERLNQTP